jgi:hypothetical protein
VHQGEYFLSKSGQCKAPINQSLIVDVGETNGPNFVITHKVRRSLSAYVGMTFGELNATP